MVKNCFYSLIFILYCYPIYFYRMFYRRPFHGYVLYFYLNYLFLNMTYIVSFRMSNVQYCLPTAVFAVTE